MSFLIRPGTEADISGCDAIDRSFPSDRVLIIDVAVAAPEHNVSLRLRQVKPSGSRRTHEMGEAEFRKAISEAAMFWVGETAEQVRGYLIFKTWDWQRLVGEISYIAVDRPYHRAGIGTALVEAAKGYAATMGLRAIMWETQTDNLEAIEFALSRGFVLGGYHAYFYENDGFSGQTGTDFIGMALFLSWPNPQFTQH